MFEPETLLEKPEQKEQEIEAELRPKAVAVRHWPVVQTPAEDLRQRRLMLAALALLLITLGGVIYHDREFWFPSNAQEAESDAGSSVAPKSTAPARVVPPAQKAATPAAAASHAKHKAAGATTKPATPPPTAPTPAATPGPNAQATSRTVLPPLEVEVVAGDSHRTLRPGSNSVHVDLQPSAPTQPAGLAQAAGTTGTTETAANVTNNAAERVHMSADTSAVVTHSVKPGYPMLARQMKVQGSVVLRALIGKDGVIQDLHVVSGPSILANAAEDAVRQWRFKPHYLGTEPVETQANITVNFTISTN